MDRPGLSGSQRFLTRWVGPETAAAVQAHSRAWLVQCPNCGLERSIWEIGGVRYKAAGNPRRRMRCPRCGQAGWHEVHKAANFPAGDVPAWPIVRLILAVLLVLLLLAALIAGLALKLTGVI
jgi:hypothetical protein